MFGHFAQEFGVWFNFVDFADYAVFTDWTLVELAVLLDALLETVEAD